MMPNPLDVSVILPVFNGERYLSEAIESIFAQSYPPTEIIVVDDGSTDQTAQVARHFGNRVHYLYQHNQGPAVARNRAVALAKGDLFAFLDADDWWHPEKLQCQIEFLMQQPELGYVLCHMRTHIEANVTWPVALNQAHYQNDPPCFLPSALLVRRHVFQKVGFFDPSFRYSDDADWFLRARDAAIPMRIVAKTLIYKRIHHNNLSHTPAMTQETLQVLHHSIQRQRQAYQKISVEQG